MINFPKEGRRIGGFRSIRVFNMFANDCEQYKKEPVIWTNLVDRTHGNPCETGCPTFKEGACPTYKRIVHKIHGVPAVTNKERAANLGVSARQVSKMRKAGRVA